MLEQIKPEFPIQVCSCLGPNGKDNNFKSTN